jgi:hypothetical protein
MDADDLRRLWDVELDAETVAAAEANRDKALSLLAGLVRVGAIHPAMAADR